MFPIIRRFPISKQVLKLRRNTDLVSVSKTLPDNLILADPTVLDELPQPIVEESEFIFPRHPKFIPNSIEVYPFNSNNNNNNESDIIKSVDLNKQIFGVAFRSDIINNVIRYLRHKRRQPKKTKRMDSISGSGKKPHPQKRQGKAQAGNKRNSVWRGGQKAHGPVLRDYSINMPKKIRALGMMIVLSMKLREGNLKVVNNFHIESHKTKDLLDIISSNEHNDINATTNTIYADSVMNMQSEENNFHLASRNIPWINYLPQTKLDVYNLMQKPKLVITASALEELQERIISQYHHTGKHYKYNNVMLNYTEIAGKVEPIVPEKKYELA
eukprot:TRINITY_DN95208_c0_g1_i1.p1 TRINITY_DN95208_c0_g1~~TRINITY_DN95208_c0_g1_i1.p1  ORF type:complete len:327 (-),score=-28.39 TRINITY_DN95208_c0_g1_i1:68-1048(-)